MARQMVVLNRNMLFMMLPNTTAEGPVLLQMVQLWTVLSHLGQKSPSDGAVLSEIAYLVAWMSLLGSPNRPPRVVVRQCRSERGVA